MKKTIAFVLCALNAIQTAAQSENLTPEKNLFEVLPEKFDAAAEFESFGYCLALSKTVFGAEGPYVESDIQWAQNLKDTMLEFKIIGKDSATASPNLNPDLSVAVGSRFFVSEKQEQDGSVTQKMEAAELHVQLGSYFTELIWKNMGLDADKRDSYIDRIPTVYHGYKFDHMFSDDDVVEMRDLTIMAVLFDEENYFAGFKFKHIKTDKVYVDSHLSGGKLFPVFNAHAFTGNMNVHTRLMGFRTTKECKESKLILSVQPIYFSTDKNQCTQYLQSLSPG